MAARGVCKGLGSPELGGPGVPLPIAASPLYSSGHGHPATAEGRKYSVP